MMVERFVAAPPARIYAAWTTGLDRWFAQPGELVITPRVGCPFFFYSRHDWGRHAHYGRLLALDPDERVRMTWLTGPPGTRGDETVLEVQLRSQGAGTLVCLAHSGFGSEVACRAHAQNWPAALQELEAALLQAPGRE